MTVPTLPTVRLGADGPSVGVQGLGCMGMSEFYGPTDRTEALATLDAALEAGVTLFDTADAYGFGRNEELIGPFIRANRDKVVLATKFALERKEEDPSYAASATTRRTSGPPRTPRCAASAWTRSTSTTCTAVTRPCRWPNRSAPWPSWSGPARCAGWACPR